MTLSLLGRGHYSTYLSEFRGQHYGKWDNDQGLSIYLKNSEGLFYDGTPMVALIVEKDAQVEKVRTYLNGMATNCVAWAGKIKRIVSLETAKRMLEHGDQRYARIETWPD